MQGNAITNREVQKLKKMISIIEINIYYFNRLKIDCKELSSNIEFKIKNARLNFIKYRLKEMIFYFKKFEV